MTDNEEHLNEIKRCKEDLIYFMEKYCMINGSPIVLSDYARKFLEEYQGILNREQTKGIIYGFALADKFIDPGLGLKNLEEFLDTLPKKKHNINFTWNLKNDDESKN